jgi:hypothetical protein
MLNRETRRQFLRVPKKRGLAPSLRGACPPFFRDSYQSRPMSRKTKVPRGRSFGRGCRCPVGSRQTPIVASAFPGRPQRFSSQGCIVAGQHRGDLTSGQSQGEPPYLERRSEPSVQTDFLERIPRTISSRSGLFDRGVARGHLCRRRGLFRLPANQVYCSYRAEWPETNKQLNFFREPGSLPRLRRQRRSSRRSGFPA